MTTTRPEFDTELFKKGAAIRREVLGANFVKKSDAANVDDLMVPLRKLITESCWGDVWSRPGLDRKTRSFVNLGMLIGLNRPHELRLHLRGAINNGITVAEIQEVILQSAIYCGAPAALDAMKAAREIIAEMKQERNASS
ncbi:MAG: 4-carboxymuconolactone decarboxylase [Candidimonas sp.]|nr:MAG: 4-carboxymuconolactone decarboxylase [Candidimonas sp.]